MSNKRQVPSPLEGFPDEGFYTLEAESRRRELFLRGLTTGSARRRRAFVFLGCWALFSVMVVATLVVVYG